MSLWEVPKTPTKRKVKRKTEAQKKKERGKKSYRKGLKYEEMAENYLKRRGYKSTTSSRERTKVGEIDRILIDPDNKMVIMEAKNQKNPISASGIKKLKIKIQKSAIVKSGIFVSSSGFTIEAKREAAEAGIKLFVYRPRRRKRLPRKIKTGIPIVDRYL